VRALAAAGLVPEIEGTGKVVRQSPAIGAMVAKGTTVRIVLEPSS
jgi:beta-lactam-binding protein with PASTA domain